MNNDSGIHFELKVELVYVSYQLKNTVSLESTISVDPMKQNRYQVMSNASSSSLN